MGANLVTYVRLRLAAGDGLSETERLRAGASRTHATRDAARALRVTVGRVNELIRTAEAARLLGPVGGLSYSSVRALRCLILRPSKGAEKSRRKDQRPSGWEEWRVRPQFVGSGPALVRDAVAGGWTEREVHVAVRALVVGGTDAHRRSGREARTDMGATVPRVYTTGEVAAMCRCAPRTVAGWCDSGRLESFRVPGSDHRRVYAHDLRRFMLRSGMVLPPELVDAPLVSLCAPSPVGVPFDDPLELAAFCGAHHALRAIVGDALGVPVALAAVRFLLRHDCARVVLVLSDDTADPGLGDPRVRVARVTQDWGALV